MAINCGEAIGPTFGGIMTNMYNFQTACKGTSLLNMSYALLYAVLNYNIMKKHFDNIDDNPTKELELNQEYADIKYTELDNPKNYINDKIFITSKSRGYSFSSFGSKRNSRCNTLVNYIN